MMVYAVDKHMDVLKVRKDEHPTPYKSHYAYFTSEQEAKDYIVARAKGHLLQAESALRGAQLRLKKCERKFGSEPMRNRTE